MVYLLEYFVYFCVLLLTVFATSIALKINPQKQRYESLDGLRGVCAAMVAIFHLYWRNGGIADNYWSIDYINLSQIKNAIYMSGQLPVGVFFMLSGFLFFKKAIASNFDFTGFAVSRIARIYPPVIATLAIIYAATFIMGIGTHTAPDSWFVRSLPFLFNPPGANINGISLQIATSGVFWSLTWELRLYLAIPFLFLILRKVPRKIPVVIAGMIAILVAKHFLGSDERLGYLMFFLCGFLIATIKTDKRPPDWFCVVIFIAAIYFTRHAYNPTTAIYMAVVFYIIKSGFSFWGFLTSKPLQLLGMCSFSLYLVHGVMQLVSKHYLYSTGGYVWQLCSVAAAGVLAPVMYKLIESRCIISGRGIRPFNIRRISSVNARQ